MDELRHFKLIKIKTVATQCVCVYVCVRVRVCVRVCVSNPQVFSHNHEVLRALFTGCYRTLISFNQDFLLFHLKQHELRETTVILNILLYNI